MSSPSDPSRVPSLAERLGHNADARLLIVSCDDLGSCHAANIGVYEALRLGVATCASVMMPAPWARHAASMYDGDDIGVHLTLNAEHDMYRWGPITHAPSLLSGEGGFPSSIDDLWEHADPDDVRRECRAQIERAIGWGFDVTHLAPHLSSITLRPEFFDIYLDLACEFRLPIRLPSSITEEQAGFPFRRLAAEEGIVFPDHFDLSWRAGSKARVIRTIENLEPGVTEVHVQPAIDTPEVRALTPDAEGWIADYQLAVPGDEIRQSIEAAGATLIGYRHLRDAMRA
jgi:chitin disaccharide deacetylase